MQSQLSGKFLSGKGFFPDGGVGRLSKMLTKYAEFMPCGFFFVALAPCLRPEILISGWELVKAASGPTPGEFHQRSDFFIN
jgi:hypothetical protein